MPMNRPHRVGLVGVGPISDWHVRAIRASGMEIAGVSTRPGSRRLAEFAQRHGIARVFEGWREMFARGEDFDAFVIATRPDGTPEILEAALALGVPLLVEKPVAWSSERLDSLIAKAHSRVLVGYNRRFYRPVLAARDEARGGPPVLVQLSLPEGVATPDGPDPDSLYLRPFFENSCHGIDMVRFLLGDLRVEAVRLMRANGFIGGVTAILSTQRGDLVSFLGNWGTPANYAVTLHRPGRRLELLPFEAATVYEGMDMIDPSDEWPIRRYVPRQTERIHLDAIDRKEKPGFIAQAEVFRDLIEGRPGSEFAATLADARAAVALCESILGVRYAS